MRRGEHNAQGGGGGGGGGAGGGGGVVGHASNLKHFFQGLDCIGPTCRVGGFRPRTRYIT